jgi:DNA-binding GntR family transcriptional regulator
VPAPIPLGRVSTVDALAGALRRAILDGERPAGSRLREQELCDGYGVARHSLRAALRVLAGEGLVRLEPNRGARVAELGPDDVRWLYELRAALELEAAHLALERHGGRLPASVHAAQRALEEACAGRDPAWSAVADAHLSLHAALVAAAESPRIAAAHATLAGEMRLFLLQLRPHAGAGEIAADHAALLAALEREGPAPLREHLRAAADVVGSAGRATPQRRPPRA